MPTKTIGTYEKRKEADRYSRRREMQEIAENDYNLNISRYISTSEAEIDLADNHAKLIEIG